MDVVLIFPRMEYGEHSPPLGLGYIAAVLENSGFKVSIVDLTFSKSFVYLEKELANSNPKLIGISCQTTFAEDAFKATEVCKKVVPDVPVAIGGPHPTILPEQTLKESKADIIVKGEGEYTFREIAECIVNSKKSLSEIPGLVFLENSKVIDTGERQHIENLDEIPFPARHLFDKRYFEYPEITVIASRGCPFNCTFCQPTLRKLFGNKVRLRSPQNVIAEIKYIIKSYGNKTVRFHDDTFTWDKNWVKEFCGLIEKENLRFEWDCKTRVDVVNRELIRYLKKAGCKRVDLGVESGSQRILDDVLNKKTTIDQIKTAFKICREEGMSTLAYLMVGNPTEEPEDLLQTINLMEEIKSDGVHVSICTPFPGTKLFNLAMERGQITAKSWRDYDFYSKCSMVHDY